MRWATHGIPNEINAHPHSSDVVSVVHNGIIENSDELKKALENKGLKFKSQTDTEVITLLITESLKTLEPLEAVFDTLKKLRGSFALGIIFKNFPNFIIGARRGSPLAVGYSEGENYLAQILCLKTMTNKVSYLDDGELCVLSKNNVTFYDKIKNKINKKIHIVSDDQNITDKGDYKITCLKKFLSNQLPQKNVSMST